ncbi:YdeI/OmpD-associated family protein [Actinocrispum wychmicini]|uniref:Bacteriocin resistance YdeI/OmpD-like protein n=1 Tax=Actinocrispum wychmicini TaxID=1213861 RepID=A0A4V2S684_9PSEU|nr:YdeI/OmpD-associated family protein [Actinocrispum wychmicini]TCO55080.1 bacteriocin resistance YdeI/OmpD-like protein [Actinocrispum wychmicini]
MKFRTTVELGGKTATGIAVPDDIVDGFDAGKRPAVKITIEGFTYRTTVARMGGRYMVPLSAENRTAAGVEAGAEVEVRIELDTEPRVVTVPDDFAAALGEARPAFDRMSYSHQKEWVRSIEDAKSAATRERRIAKAVSEIRAK